jgi:hypothetical protein
MVLLATLDKVKAKDEYSTENPSGAVIRTIDRINNYLHLF